MEQPPPGGEGQNTLIGIKAAAHLKAAVRDSRVCRQRIEAEQGVNPVAGARLDAQYQPGRALGADIVTLPVARQAVGSVSR
jgi:hypothetical protein